MKDCIFCKIAHGDAPCHKVWEDDKHLAFLSIFPNTDGFTVVIPKEHYDSYFAKVPADVLDGLMAASAKVAQLLDSKFEDVGRTALVFEGFGVDHLHSKLIPMHGTAKLEDHHTQPEALFDKYFEQYEGYISTHSGNRADDDKLAEIAKRLQS